MIRAVKSVRWDGVALAGVAAGSVYTLASAATETSIGDADKASTFPTPGRSRVLTSAVVDKLNEDGLYVMHDVLSPAELTAAHAGAVAVYKEGRMKPTTNDISVRQDRVCWVREADGAQDAEDGPNKLLPGLLHCVQMLRGLSVELEDLNYDRSQDHYVPKQCQLSRYSGDGSQSYMAHRDAASKSDFWEIGLLEWLRSKDYRRRRVTAILYLNLPGWDVQEDGGQLKCYMDCDEDDRVGSTSSTIEKIAPVGGTLVLFDSTALLHEVEPSHRDRYALTLWVTGDDVD